MVVHSSSSFGFWCFFFFSINLRRDETKQTETDELKLFHWKEGREEGIDYWWVQFLRRMKCDVNFDLRYETLHLYEQRWNNQQGTNVKLLHGKGGGSVACYSQSLQGGR